MQAALYAPELLSPPPLGLAEWLQQVICDYLFRHYFRDWVSTSNVCEIAG